MDRDFCALCQGQGEIFIYDYELSIEHHETCSRCDGSGIYKHRSPINTHKNDVIQSVLESEAFNAIFRDFRSKYPK